MDGFDWLEPEHFPVWRRRLELERRAHNLTPARRDCLRALLCFVGDEGLFPSDAAVGDLAGYSARTVQRARQDAKALGLLSWERTRKVVEGRWRQGSNRYSVIVPTSLVCARPGGQAVRGRQTVSKDRRLTGAMTAALVVPVDFPSLAEIARTREAAQAAAYWARRIGIAGVASAG